MSTRLRNWFFFPIRTPKRAALSAALAALLAFAGWYGERSLRFRRDYGAAKDALARYDFPEARQRLASCLELRTSDPAARLLAVQAARRDGLLDEAQEHLDRYGELLDVSTPAGNLQDLLLRVQRGQVKEFVHTLLDDLEVRHPESEQILESLALGCQHAYRLDEASFWIKQLLNRFPHNPTGRLLDAQMHETMRRRDRAVEIMCGLLEDYPRNDKARFYLAGLLSASRQYEEAVHHFRDLHRRQPAEIKPLLGLVRALLPLDRFDEAVPLLHRLEEEHADNTEAVLECGRFALRQKRPEDALRLLRRAVLQAPNDHEIHLELAVCLRQLDRADESDQHLQRHKQIEADMKLLESAFQAMVKAPADPAPRVAAGQICLRNGDKSEGLRWLIGALEIAPNHPAAHAALADYYAAERDFTRANYHRQRAR